MGAHHVVHVLGSLDVGGAELRTIDVLRRIRGHGVVFDFVTLSGREGVLAEEVRSLGATVTPMRLSLAFVPNFIGHLRRVQPYAVHSHVATFSGAVLALARVASVPRRIAHFRSDGDLHGHSWRRRVQRRIMRLLIRRCATDIVAVSPSAMEGGMGPRKANDPTRRVIVNGVDVRQHLRSGQMRPLLERLGVPPDAAVVMHVGRPSPEKNRARVVEVFAEVARHDPNVHLVLVGGQGEDRDVLNHAIASTGLVGRIHDAGMHRPATPWMAEADVVLNTSTREGLPGVLLEASGVGTPVVASDVPGAVFIADRVDSVRVISLTQSDQVWAEAVTAVLADRRDEAARQHRADKFADSCFSLDGTVLKFLDLYGLEPVSVPAASEATKDGS